jgi:hypothetical protein
MQDGNVSREERQMFRSGLNRALVIVFALAVVAFTASGVPDDDGIDAAIGWFGFLALALVFVVLAGSAAVRALRRRSGHADTALE